MPAARDEGRKRPKRKSPLAGARGTGRVPVEQSPSKTTTRPVATPQRSGPFGPLSAQGPAFSSQRAQQDRQRQRAARKLPARPVPSIPVLRNPTRGQERAATRLANRSIQRQVARGPVRERVAQQQEIVQELRTDPRTRHQAAVIDYYGQRQRGRLTPEAIAALTRSEARPKAPDRKVGIGPASINITAASEGLARLIDEQTSLNKGDLGPRQFFNAAVSDVKAIGTSPFIAAYEGGRAALDLAGGDSRRAETLAKGLAKGVAESVPGRLVQGDVKGATEEFRRHPIISVLDVGGVASIGGRAAGALARGAGSTPDAPGVRGALARAGSTVRSPLALTDDAAAARGGLLVERTFSKDTTRKGAQVLSDATREPLKDRDGNVVTVRQRGRDVPVLKTTADERAGLVKGRLSERERLLRRRGNFDASRASAAERVERERAAHAEAGGGVVRGSMRGAARRVRARDPRGRMDDLRVMATTGVIRTAETVVEDLRKEARRIRGELAKTGDDAPYATREERKTAGRLVKTLERAADSPRAAKREVREALLEAGERAGRDLRASDEAAVAHKLLSPEVARRTPLQEYAIAHMGARHVTEERHAALEADARTVEREAAERAKAAPDGSPEQAVALRDLAAAREERIAVSGRDPKKVKRHEVAAAARRAATADVKTAKARVARAEKARARLTGTQASRRGRRMRDPDASAAATRAEQAALARAGTEVTAARAELKAAKSSASKARRRLAENPMPPVRAAMRDSTGRRLSDEDIEEHMRTGGGDPRAARDPATVAFVPHRAEAEQRGSHHQPFRPGTRPHFEKGEVRTGEMFHRGLATRARDLLRDEYVRKAVAITKAEELDKSIGEMGLRHPAWAKAERGDELTAKERKIVDKGGYMNADEGDDLARRMKSETGEPWVPVRAFGAKLTADEQADVRENWQRPASFETLHLTLLNSRLRVDKGTRARSVVLVPKTYVDQLADHAQPAGKVERMVQMLNRPFRMAVLPQPRWIAGNVAEPGLVRLPLKGGGVILPGAIVNTIASVRTLRAMERHDDPKVRQAAREIRAQQTGGLFIGRKGASNRRTYEDLSPGVTRKIAEMVNTERQGMKQFAWLMRAVPLTFFAANRLIESAAQHQALGKGIREDIQAFTGSWWKTIRLADESLQDVGRGLVGTPAQERHLRAQHELLGQYGEFSPATRRLIQSAMPFLPWTANAARFVYWTLPVHSTVTEALLLKTAEVYAEAWEEAHRDVPPGMKLAIPTEDGGWIDLARYSPFGFSGPVSEGEYKGLTSPLLPQFHGFIEALEGDDPFDRPLKKQPTPDNPKGEVRGIEKFGVAGLSLAEGVVPNLALSRRLREGGGTAYADSTVVSPKVKPESLGRMGAVERTLSPLRPVYLRNQAAGSLPASVSPATVEHYRRQAEQQRGKLPPGVTPATVEHYRRLAAQQAGR